MRKSTLTPVLITCWPPLLNPEYVRSLRIAARFCTKSWMLGSLPNQAVKLQQKNCVMEPGLSGVDWSRDR